MKASPRGGTMAINGDNNDNENYNNNAPSTLAGFAPIRWGGGYVETTHLEDWG